MKQQPPGGAQPVLMLVGETGEPGGNAPEHSFCEATVFTTAPPLEFLTQRLYYGGSIAVS